MAGDWIKMRHNLLNDPAVIMLTEQLTLDPDAVLGKLYRLWSWADAHTEDGNAVGVTLSWVERYVGVSGFAQVLIQAGWLTPIDGGICIPNFDRHNSNSAKRRALTNERVKRKRNATSVTEALPEKRREEKNKKKIKNTGTVVPASRTTWLTAFSEAWRDHYGGPMPVKPSLGPLAEVRKALGDEEALSRWCCYLAATEGSYASAARFAATVGEWSASAPRRRPNTAAGQTFVAIESAFGKGST